DPAGASAIHPANVQRIIRALEVYEITKKPITELHNYGKKRGGLSAGKNGLLIFGLNMPRQELYSRINRRSENMLKNGMIEETEELLKTYPENIPALSSTGYPHVIDFLKGRIDRKILLEKVSQDTRNYAKRQITWFKADKQIRWFDSNQDPEIISRKILKIWKK
ncbi:MAG: tRNA dimethylallyltransferase, partial [Elusimicrobiota bacterium]